MSNQDKYVYLKYSCHLLIVFILISFPFTSALAGIKYVDVLNGSDSAGCGPIGSPCASIQFALDNIVTSGDEIRINPGVYSVGNGLDLSDSNHLNITLTAADTLNPPTLRGNAGESVVKINQGITGITVSNLKMEHNPSGPISTFNSGSVQVSADHTTITQNEIYNGYNGIGILSGKNINITNNNIHIMGNAGLGNCLRLANTTTTNWSEKIYIHQNEGHHCAESGIQIVNTQFIEISNNNFHSNKDGLDFRDSQNLRIHNNTFHGNSRFGIRSEYSNPTFNIEIWSNRIHDNNQNGILINGSNQINWKIFNNLIYNNCSNPTAVTICLGADLGSSGAEFFHNVIYGHSPNNVPGGSVIGGSRIKNNAFYNNGIGSGGGNNGGGGDHNYVFPAAGDQGTNAVTDPAPLFANPASGQFALQANSPLIDAGINAGILTDFEGNPRPLGKFDIGAFESGRHPIDYGLIMDFSGSMRTFDGLPQNRWIRAKRAADLFAAVLALLKIPGYDDRIAIMDYAWSCSGNDTAGNMTGEMQGVSIAPTTIPNVPPTGTNSFTSGNSLDPAPDNCTPIQQGLMQGLRNGPTDAEKGMYGPFDPSAERERILVLLSDGFHNKPPAHAAFTNDPGGPFTTVEKSLVPVYTVALGPDGSAGTQLLSDISLVFNSSLSQEARYNNPLNFPQLLNSYLEIIENRLKTNKVDQNADGSFDPGTADKLIFIGLWDDPTGAGQLKVQRDGTDVPSTTTYENQKIGFSAVVVTNPLPGGNWVLDLDGASTAPDQKYAIVDLREFAHFFIEQKPYHVGESILLNVKLSDRGIPILEADATVDVKKPGEALGNYLSTVQEDCSARRPTLPLKTAARSGNRVMMVGSTTATGRASGDPIPGRYAIASHHFNRCKKESLRRDSLANLQLYDDGTNGDQSAGDGVYSLAYNDADVEGTYTFHFHVDGRNIDNIKFTRTRTLSQFVKIKPESKNTNYHLQTSAIDGSKRTERFAVLPRDRSGNYLGPGYGDQIKFKTTAGRFTGSMIDHENGFYSQMLHYDESKDRPVVSADVQGEKFREIKIFKSVEFVLPFIGWSFFDDNLDLKDGTVLGARFNYRITHKLSAEFEGGVTFTETTFGDQGNVYQALANLRYDLYAARTRIGELRPYITAGAGYSFFRGFGKDDEAFAYQGGIGTTLKLGNSFGIRLDGRLLGINDVMNSGATTNAQVTGGFVFWF